MTRDQFAKLFALLRGSFPSQQVTPDTFEAYYALLGHHEYETARPAVARVLSTAKFWPAPGVIAENIAEAATRQPEPSTVLAEIHDAVRRFSQRMRPHPPEISECADYVIGCIGWWGICNSKADDSVGMNAHMLKIAGTYRQKAMEEWTCKAAGLLSSAQPLALPEPKPAESEYPVFKAEPRAEPTPEDLAQRKAVMDELFRRVGRKRDEDAA